MSGIAATAHGLKLSLVAVIGHDAQFAGHRAERRRGEPAQGNVHTPVAFSECGVNPFSTGLCL